VYRDRLLSLHRRRTQGGDGGGVGYQRDLCLYVDLAHVNEFDPALYGLLVEVPDSVLPDVEAAAGRVMQGIVEEVDRGGRNGEGEESAQQEGEEEEGLGGGPWAVQVMLKANLAPTVLRHITSSHLHRLLLVPGIVLSASPVRSKCHLATIRCSRCNHRATLSCPGPFKGMAIPQQCMGERGDCGPAPYSLVDEACAYYDQQTCKLQEMPEAVPTGEMPRHILLSVDRGMVDRLTPGMRVNIYGIVSLISSGGGGAGGKQKGDGARTVFIRAVGFDALARDHAHRLTGEEEEAFLALSRREDIYDVLSNSVAPSLSGAYTVDIKKALAAQLFGGAAKTLPDGMRLRGDVHILLMGDPSTAKSQFLKFIELCAPVAVYTSGKGSSAAGLTASVVRDSRGEFYLEGGAMVLADGGVVCIDEFDKMRADDRVSIHEAMEQGTISVAKAGITTVLNSRTSVLAAANPVFGRYDDLKSASENIDLMTTILSRFDLIFIVRDIREEERDRAICNHVMGVHMNSDHTSDGSKGNYDENTATSRNLLSPAAVAEEARAVARGAASDLSVHTMKKYVRYCRERCSPRLSEGASEALASSYVRIREGLRKRCRDGGGQDAQAVPITVRQLEALVRLSESLAKMRMSPEVASRDIEEAVRLFQVSTMAASSTDAASVGSTLRSLMPEAREEMERAERFLLSRVQEGTVANKRRVVEEAVGQGFHSSTMAKAVAILAMKGVMQERNQGRLIKRLK